MASPRESAATRGIERPPATDAARGTNRRDSKDRGTALTQSQPRPDEKEPPPVQLAGAPQGLVNIWVFRKEFNFLPNPDAGWPVVFEFGAMKDILDGLKDRKLEHRVAKLGITAHGDTGGVVLVDGQKQPGITLKTLSSFESDFKQTAEFLAPDGLLIFESCVAGKDVDGSQLIRRISSLLQPRQQVVAFVVYGVMGSTFAAAGNLLASPSSMTGMPERQAKGLKKLDENSEYAKWANQGRIVRLPAIEELSNLRGAWTITSAIRGGKTAAEFEGAVLNVSTVSALEISSKGKPILAGTYDADFRAQPRTIDVKITAGKPNNKTLAGIYRYGEQDFDRLTICFSEPLASPTTAAKKPAKASGKPSATTPAERPGVDAAKPFAEKRPTDFSSPSKSKQLLLELTRSA